MFVGVMALLYQHYVDNEVPQLPQKYFKFLSSEEYKIN